MLVRFKLREAAGGQILATLTVKRDGQDDQEFEGQLPPVPTEVVTAFNRWRSTYLGLGSVRLRLTPVPSQTHSSQEELADYVNDLKAKFNDWIDRSDRDWQRMQQHLAVLAQQVTGETRIVLDAKDSLLRRLPWQEWDLLRERFPQVEVAIRASSDVQAVQAAAGVVRILVVVGNSEGIEPGVQQDMAALKSLENQGAKVCLLMQPTAQQLLAELRQRPYEIFVFTGHSGSDSNGQIGWIDLSPHERLTLSHLENALKAAIRCRLQLCIFNSCDGLGLAAQLANVNLPVSIVMREPVPDDVATHFLRIFLTQFAGGASLFAAVREAREYLEGFTQYPGVLWLPVICLGNSVAPPTWQTFQYDHTLRLNSPEPNASELPSVTPLVVVPPGETVSSANSAQPQWKLLGVAAGLAAGFAALLLVAVVKPLTVMTPSPEVQPSTSVSAPLTLPTERPWRFGGSNSAIPLQASVQAWLSQAQPNFQLEFKLLAGSNEGLQQLKQGNLDFAITSEPLVRADEALGLEATPVAIDGIAVVVHPSLTGINHLSLEQLQQIYTSQVTNWRQLGGPNRPIVPISRDEKSGTTRFFRHEVLKGAPFGKTVKLLQSITADLGKVATNPGSIYFGTAAQLVGQCRVKPLPLLSGNQAIAPYAGKLVPRDRACTGSPRNQPNATAFQAKTYPLARSLFVVTKRNTEQAEQAGKAYIALLQSPTGQEVIQAAGFVPVPKGY